MPVNIAVPFTRAQNLIVLFWFEVGETNRWHLALWRGGITWTELLPGKKMLIWLYGIPDQIFNIVHKIEIFTC